MKRWNITLPDVISMELASVHHKSRFIAEALEMKFKQTEKEKMDKLLIEGYSATRHQDKTLNGEWEDITLENW